jgi:TM2 domain-containing membrane protein YozV
MYPNQPGPYNQGPYQPGPYAQQGPYGQGPYQQPYQQPYNPYAAAYPQPHPMGYDAQRMMMYDANKKSATVAYLLWFFLGMLGAHRFYLDRSGSAVAQMLITFMSWLLLFVFVGIFTLAAVGMWVLVDAFLIPDWIREHNNRLIARLNY